MRWNDQEATKKLQSGVLVLRRVVGVKNIDLQGVMQILILWV